MIEELEGIVEMNNSGRSCSFVWNAFVDFMREAEGCGWRNLAPRPIQPEQTLQVHSVSFLLAGLHHLLICNRHYRVDWTPL